MGSGVVQTKVALCLETWGDSSELGVSYDRGTPVAAVERVSTEDSQGPIMALALREKSFNRF